MRPEPFALYIFVFARRLTRTLRASAKSLKDSKFNAAIVTLKKFSVLGILSKNECFRSGIGNQWPPGQIRPANYFFGPRE